MIESTNFEDRYLDKDNIFEYKNSITTYHLRFVQDSKIREKINVMCAIENLESEVKKAIDEWEAPHEMDSLVLTVCAFDKVDFGGNIYFLSSYTVEIELAEPSHLTEAEPTNDILLPFFEFKQPDGNRYIKPFGTY